MMFDGKVVFITGAAGGIGQSLCRYFGSQGAAIGLIDQSDAVDSVAEELAGEGIDTAPARVDISDAAAVKQGFATLTERLGTVDILINNAGFSKHPTFARTDPAGWEHDPSSAVRRTKWGASMTRPWPTEERQSKIHQVCVRASWVRCIWPMCATRTAISFVRCTGLNSRPCKIDFRPEPSIELSLWADFGR